MVLTKWVYEQMAYEGRAPELESLSSEERLSALFRAMLLPDDEFVQLAKRMELRTHGWLWDSDELGGRARHPDLRPRGESPTTEATAATDHAIKRLNNRVTSERVGDAISEGPDRIRFILSAPTEVSALELRESWWLAATDGLMKEMGGALADRVLDHKWWLEAHHRLSTGALDADTTYDEIMNAIKGTEGL